MKRLILLTLAVFFLGYGIFLALKSPSPAFAQTGNPPDCSQSSIFTRVQSGQSLPTISGSGNGCVGFRLTWYSTTFTGYTIALQGSQDNSTWANIDSSLVQEGTNPTSWTSSTKSNTIVVRAYFPWVRINVSSVTGTGNLYTTLYGYKGTSAQWDVNGGGGSSVSITAAGRGGPIIVTPSPITGTGVISLHGTGLGNYGVTANAVGTYHNCAQWGATGDLEDYPASCGGLVTSVFGQTGTVDIPITTTDISTPSNPSAGMTTSYSKGGKWCALDPSGAETCTGSGGGGGGSVNPACTFSTSATGCTINTSTLAVPSANYNSLITQCWTGASTTQTTVAILTYVYTTGSGIVQSVAPTFSAAAAAGYCTVNAGGGGGGGGCNTSTGSITSLPGSPGSCDIYLPSDSQYNLLRYNGSSWDYFFNGAKVVRPTGSYSWTNQGSATNTSQVNGSITIQSPNSAGSDQLRVFDTLTPSTPYTAIYRFRAQADNDSTSGSSGIVLRELATGKLIIISPWYQTAGGTCPQTQPCLSLAAWNSVTSFNSGLSGGLTTSVSVTAPWFTISIADAGIGGNLTVSFSIDNGITYTAIYTAARNAFFTVGPDHIGLFINNNNSNTGIMSASLISVN